MKIHLSRFSRQNQLLLALLLASLLLLAAALGDPRPVEINSEFEGATIQITAHKSWSLFPGDCLEIGWQVEGIESIYIDGQGKIGWGEMAYCPSFGAASPEFLITAQNGAVDTFTLDLSFGPDELLICLLFVMMLTPSGLAGYYLARPGLNKRVPITWSAALLFAIALVACLLVSASDLFSVWRFMLYVGQLFASPAWHWFGAVVAVSVFVPIMIQELRSGIRAKATADFVAIALFLAFLLLLQLPFGFESIGQWEEWVSRAYLEGRPSRLSDEMVLRFWILVPRVFAIALGPNSFAGYHWVNLLMFWGKLALFYGVLRKLNVAAYLAILCTILFLVYPVNPNLMSLRSYPHTFSSLSLLAGAYLVLDYRANPSRLRLLGIWLALLFSIGSYEAGYVIILLIPLFWFRRMGLEWRSVNLTVIWYLVPAAKVLYLLLLIAADQVFYLSRTLFSAVGSARSLLGALEYYLNIVSSVYRQTFATGWHEALNAVSQNTWIAPTVAALVITGLTAIYLARDPKAGALPSRRQAIAALFGGVAFVLPSIGVLMWFEHYNQDLWRMYVYVPIGAAVAVFSLLVLAASCFRNLRIRRLVVVAASLLLMFPATLRLFVQNAQYPIAANAKAAILRQMIEQAPAIDSETYVMLLSELDSDEMSLVNIWEFKQSMFDGSVFVLYDGNGPQHAFLCFFGGACHSDDIPAIREDDPQQITGFSNLVIFRLHEDLSVELLRELPPELGLDDRGSYNPDRLIDYAAPLPARAVTMLGAAGRGN